MPPAAAAPETEEDVKPQTDDGADVSKPAAQQPQAGKDGQQDNFSVVHEAPRPTPAAPQAPAPVMTQTSDDADARHQDVYKQVDTKARQAFNEEHPFAPSDWQAPTPEPAYRDALRQSDAEAKTSLEQRNAQLEGQMRGTGQKYYRDASGLIQPVIEPQTGKPLFDEQGRTQGVNPETNQPAWVKRDRYGKPQYETPSMVANPTDPTDNHLYYDFGNGKQVPAGKIDDLIKSSDFKVARTALKARNSQRSQVWKEAIAPMADVVAATSSQYDQAQLQHDSLGAQAEKLQQQIGAIDANPQLQETEGGILGIGAKPSKAATDLQKNRQALQDQLQQLTTQQTDLAGQLQKGGSLWTQRRDAQLHLAIFKAKAAHDNYSDLADERRMILKEKGLPEDKDQVLQSIEAARQAYGAAIDQYGNAAQQQSQQRRGATGINPAQYDTKLSPSDEQKFQQWKQKFAPHDSGIDYDLRGAFKAGLTPSKENGHWPDTFKKPNHPTFSNQSIYAKDRPDLAGHWQGNTYIPPGSPPGGQGPTTPPSGGTPPAGGAPAAPGSDIGVVSDLARRFVKGVPEGAGQAVSGIGRFGQEIENLVTRPILNHFISKARNKDGTPFTQAQKQAAMGVLTNVMDHVVSKQGGLAALPFAAQDVGQRAKELAKTIQVNPNREGKTGTGLAETAGQLVGALPAAAAGPVGAVMAGSGMMRDQAHDAAIQQGDSEEVANAKADMAAFAGGVLGLIPGEQLAGSAVGKAGLKGVAAAGARVATKAAIGAGANTAADVAFQKAATGKVDWKEAAQQAKFGGLFAGLFSLPEEYQVRAKARLEAQAKNGAVDPKAAEVIIRQEAAKAKAAGAAPEAPGAAPTTPEAEPAIKTEAGLKESVLGEAKPAEKPEPAKPAAAEEKPAISQEAKAVEPAAVEAATNAVGTESKGGAPIKETLRAAVAGEVTNKKDKAAKKLSDLGYKVKEGERFTSLTDASGKEVREGDVSPEVNQAFSDFREAKAQETQPSKEGKPNAVTAGEQPQNREQQHQGIPQGENARENAAEVRTGGGAQAGDSGGIVERPEDRGKPRETVVPETKHGEIEGKKINGEWTQFAPEAKGLGIPRAEMPQVKAEHRGALVNYLKGQGIESNKKLVRPTDLKPSQNEYSEAKVEQARKFEGGDRSILVSSDNHVIDGHHQWVASLHDNPNKPIKVIKVDAPAKDLIDKMKAFPSAEAASGATKAEPGKIPYHKPLDDLLLATHGAINRLPKESLVRKGLEVGAKIVHAAPAGNEQHALRVLTEGAGKAAAELRKSSPANEKAAVELERARDAAIDALREKSAGAQTKEQALVQAKADAKNNLKIATREHLQSMRDLKAGKITEKEVAASRKRFQAAQKAGENPVAAVNKPKGRTISVGQHPEIGDDILNHIEQHGGIKTSGSEKGGEHDDIRSTFQSTAKLLLRKNGLAPDDMAMQLRDAGLLKEGTVSEMNAAVEKALKSRQQSRKSVASQQEHERFERAFLGNEQGKKYLRAMQPVSIDDLAVGDKFEVNGEKFQVTHIDADGNVKVKDHFTRTLAPGTNVFPDEGKVTKVKRNTEFLGKEEQAELLPSEEMPFNLAGKRQEVPAPTTQTKEAAPQGEMFKIEDVVKEADPVKSANQAQELYGDPGAAADKLEKQLATFDSDPANRKNFDKDQRARLKEVVALLRERATTKPNVAEMKPPALRSELSGAGIKEINGKPISEADGAQLMSAVFKLRKTQESGATPTTGVRVSDKLISSLEGLRLHKPGQLSAATPFSLAWDAALDTAILGIKAGQKVADIVKAAIDKFHERFPGATKDHDQSLEAAIKSRAITSAYKPSENPVKPQPVKGKPGQYYRSLPDTEREANAEVVRQVYQRRGQQPDLDAASEIIKHHGEEKAMQISMSKADDGVPLPVKSAIYVKLGESADKRVVEAKNPVELAKAVRARQALSTAKSPAATEQGQQIAMYAQINKNARSGSIQQHLDDIETEQNRKLGNDGKKAVDEAKTAVDKAKEEAIDKATKELNRATKQTTVTKSVWQKYRDSAAQRMLDLVEGSVTPPKEKAPLQEFAQRIVEEMKSRIEPLLPEKPAGKAPPTPGDILREAIENKEKYGDVLTTVRSEFVKQYGEGGPLMDAIDTELANLGLHPYSDRIVDRAIKEAHSLMQTSVEKIAKEHFTKTDAKAGDLADALVKDAGLTGAEATELAANISERAKALYAEGREKAIAALKQRYTNTPKARKIFDAIGKATSLNNLGALTHADVQDAVAKELHLPQVNPGQLKRIATMADKVEVAENPAAKARATLDLADEIRRARGNKWSRAIDTGTSIWYANMLSGTATVIKTGGDILNSIGQMTTAIAANPTHANTLISGWLEGLGAGFQRAKATLTTGKGGIDFNPLTGGYGEGGTAPHKLSALEEAKNPYTGALKYVPRAFKTIEAFFYHPAREAYAKLVATKLLEGEYSGKALHAKVKETLGITPAQFQSFKAQAEGEGFKGQDVGLRIGQLVEQHRAQSSVGQQAQTLGEKFGEQTVYRNEPTGVAGAIYRVLNDAVNNKIKVAGVPVLKPFLPFLRIPTNLFNESLNYTPVGAKRALFSTLNEEGKGRVEMNSDDRTRLLVKAVGGTLMMGALTAMALNKSKNKIFDISGSGPTDYNKRLQLQQTGWAPHSIKVGDHWFNYMYSPLMIPLTVVGNVSDSLKYQKHRDDMVFSSRVADATAGAGRAIMDTSMLQGLSHLMDFAKGSVSPDRFGKFLASTASSTVIPSAVRQLDEALSPAEHENTGLSGTIKSQIPFLRRQGPLRTDALGTPINYSPTQRFESTVKGDALRDMLNSRNVFVGKPSRDTKIGNRPMTEDEYDKYQRMSGQQIKTRLQAMLPSLSNMSAEELQKTVEEVSRDERLKVRKLFTL